jgi:hypothetical protein
MPATNTGAMANLVLMITCETSIADRAGALGRLVWGVLKQVPDWRWLLDREGLPLVSGDAATPAKGVRRLGGGF